MSWETFHKSTNSMKSTAQSTPTSTKSNKSSRRTNTNNTQWSQAHKTRKRLTSPTPQNMKGRWGENVSLMTETTTLSTTSILNSYITKTLTIRWSGKMPIRTSHTKSTREASRVLSSETPSHSQKNRFSLMLSIPKTARYPKTHSSLWTLWSVFWFFCWFSCQSLQLVTYTKISIFGQMFDQSWHPIKSFLSRWPFFKWKSSREKWSEKPPLLSKPKNNLRQQNSRVIWSTLTKTRSTKD